MLLVPGPVLVGVTAPSLFRKVISIMFRFTAYHPYRISQLIGYHFTPSGAVILEGIVMGLSPLRAVENTILELRQQQVRSQLKTEKDSSEEPSVIPAFKKQAATEPVAADSEPINTHSRQLTKCGFFSQAAAEVGGTTDIYRYTCNLLHMLDNGIHLLSTLSIGWCQSRGNIGVARAGHRISGGQPQRGGSGARGAQLPHA